MADSNQTKKLLAQSMKDLMAREPFAKISIGDICADCQMNRKSFYYHFRDKYDLVNWIFQTEFLLTVRDSPKDLSILSSLCQYFYDNRAFYHNALSVQGQNSFQDYFREVLEPFMAYYAQAFFEGRSEDTSFFVTFYTDALIAAMLRWLSQKNPMPPNQFQDLLLQSLRAGSTLLTPPAN